MYLMTIKAVICYQEISPMVASLCYEVILSFLARLSRDSRPKSLLKCYYCAFVEFSAFLKTDIFNFEDAKHLGPFHFYIQVCFDIYPLYSPEATLWSEKNLFHDCQLFYKLVCHLNVQSPKRQETISSDGLLSVFRQFSTIPYLLCYTEEFSVIWIMHLLEILSSQEVHVSLPFESKGYFFPQCFIGLDYLKRGVVKLNISLKKEHFVIFCIKLSGIENSFCQRMMIFLISTRGIG